MLRLVLGVAQMAGAIVSAALLATHGFTGLSMATAVATTAATAISRWLYGTRRAFPVFPS